MSEQKKDNYGVSASFDLGIAKEVGIEAAVIYNELRFWAGKGNRKDGWIYKSYAEMMEKFGLSEYQLRKIYKLLVSHGIIESKIIKVDKAPTFHYRFLKNFSFDNLVSEKTSETMETEKTSETSIYTDNYQNTASFSDSSTGREAQVASPSSAAPLHSEGMLNIFETIAGVLHPTKKILVTDGRLSKLRARLRTFKASEIHQAAQNLMKDPWNTGQNPTNTVYASFDFLMRNDEKVEEWLNKTPVPKKTSIF